MDVSLSDILAIISPIVSVAFACGVSNQKIKQLEKKVDKHNNFAERIPVVEVEIKNLDKEIEELKRGE